MTSHLSTKKKRRRRRSRSLAESVATWCARLLPELQPLQPRTLDLAQLEDRVLFNAAPVGEALPDAADMTDANSIDPLAFAAELGEATDSVEQAGLAGAAPQPADERVDTVIAEERSLEGEIPTAFDGHEQPSSGRAEIVFIDAGVENYGEFVRDLQRESENVSLEVVLLASDESGIARITTTLAGRDGIDAIHIVSHGSATGVQLGSDWLSAENVDRYSWQIGEWRYSLDAEADLLIYGCDLAGSESGQALLASIGGLCDCDVAASDDDTGQARLGGDWELEFALGAVDAGIAFSVDLQERWDGLLSLFTVTNTNDSGAGSLRRAITDANAAPGLDTIDFNITGGGPHTIEVDSALPDITDAVIIDGTTEPDFVGTPVIVLDGSGIGGSPEGLTLIAGSDGSTIRGLVINQFGGDGIRLDGSDNNTIAGNYIGTNVTGMIDLGNSRDGININNSAGNIIGGTAAADRNVIAGNNDEGIEIDGSTSSGNQVIGNLIGVGADGVTAVVNREGIWIEDAPDTVIGGTAAGAENVISAQNSGILVSGSNATGTVIQGNYIGTDVTETADIGGSFYGVLFYNTDSTPFLPIGNPSDSTVGGINPGEANVIANWSQDGVNVGFGTGHTVRGNVIHSNGELGIDLTFDNDVTANDADDSDTGSNELQNYPVLSAAAVSGTNLTVTGTLTSTASTLFDVDFYANTTADGSGHGEAERYLASAMITTDGAGNASINELLSGAGVMVGEFVTATATDPDGNTSEFALNVTATAGNMAPSISNLAGDLLAFTEDDPATVIEEGADVTVTDDSPDFDTGNLTVSVFAGGDAGEDKLSIRDQGPGTGNIGVTGSHVEYDFGGGLVMIGSFAGGSGGVDLIVTFNASANAAAAAALIENITYRNTDISNPTTTPRTIRFTLDDGDGGVSASQDTTVNVAAANDASTLDSIEGTPLAYAENAPPLAVTDTITIADVDDTSIESATVQITGNYTDGEDILAFTDTASISGSWNAATGTITLTGGDTLANYEAALRAVTYQNTANDPSTLTRTVSFIVNDGDDPSNILVRDINVTATNDQPILDSIESTPLTYAENAAPTSVTSSITVGDIDDTNIQSAVIQITGNYASGEDVLAFSDTAGITGSWNAATGTLTLSGGDTLAKYTTALRAVTYRNTSDDPSTLTRTVSLTVDDGDDPSNTVTRDINITAANDNAMIANLAGDALAYGQSSGASIIDQGSDALVSDVDSADFETGNLTVSIAAGNDPSQDILSVRDAGSGPGQIGFDGTNVTFGGVSIGTASGGAGGTDLIITFNANATPTVVSALVNHTTYENSDTTAPTLGARTVRFVIDDGDGDLSPAYDTTVTVNAAMAPTISDLDGDTLSYSEGSGPRLIDQSPAAAVTDPDSPDFETGELTVSITSGGDPAEDVLAVLGQGAGTGHLQVAGSNVLYDFGGGPTLIGSFTGGSGGTPLVVSLNGNATPLAATALIRRVSYENIDDSSPTTGMRTVQFVLADGDGATSLIQNTFISVSSTNSPAILAGIEAAPLAYSEDAGAQVVTAGLLVTDVDDTNLESASVQIVAGYVGSEDQLAFVDTPAITGNWNAATGTLTLSGTDSLASYQAALRSVTYHNTSQSPSTTARTISFTVNDGDDPSNPAFRDIHVSSMNDHATLGGIEAAALHYDEGDGPVAVTASIDIADVDDTDIESATIRITGNYSSGEDVLSFIDTPSIIGSWDPTSGTLTLTGSDSLADYETALRHVSYENTSNTPSTATRTVSFMVHDGEGPSNVAARNIAVVANGAPVSLTDGYSVSAGETLTISLPGEGVLANDSDPDSQPLSASISTPPLTGTVVLEADGTFTYTPHPDAVGTDEFYYVADDGIQTGPPTRVEITILPAPAPPTSEPSEESEVVEEAEEDEEPSAAGTPPVSPASREDNSGGLEKRHNAASEPDGTHLEEEPIVPPLAPDITTQEILVATIQQEGVARGPSVEEFVQEQANRSAESIAETPDSAITSYISPDLAFLTAGGSYWYELNNFDEQVEEDIFVDSSKIALTSGTGAAVMAGYVMWVMRGGVLLAALAAQMPAWSMLSPLPIFIGDGAEDDGEDLASMLQESNEESSPDETNGPEPTDHAV